MINPFKYFTLHKALSLLLYIKLWEIGYFHVMHSDFLIQVSTNQTSKLLSTFLTPFPAATLNAESLFSGSISINSTRSIFMFLPSLSQYRRLRFNPSVGKIPRNKAWQPLQYSYLENSVDKGAWQATVVHKVTKCQTGLKQQSMHAHWLEWNYRYINKKKWSGVGPEKNQHSIARQWIGSKLEKEYVRVEYHHPAYLAYKQCSVQFTSVTQLCLTLQTHGMQHASLSITKFWSDG